MLPHSLMRDWAEGGAEILTPVILSGVIARAARDHAVEGSLSRWQHYGRIREFCH